MNNESPEAADRWSQWVLGRRHGNDDASRREVEEVIDTIADRVLTGARLRAGMVLADVGAGDGRMGFRAIERVGAGLRVILTDISASLLRHMERKAVERGVVGQCTFMHGSAEKLEGIDDAAVDVVTTRAVLAYVEHKSQALHEFHRVLRNGGRISLAEPIMQNDAFEAMALRKMVEGQGENSELEFLRLLSRLKAAQFPSTEEEIQRSPIANFSERDLVRLARDAGFVRLHLELHIDIVPSLTRTWELFLDTSPHPLAPTTREVLAEKFSERERQFFERIMRQMIESPAATTTDLIAYLTAEKTGA
jgi:ubiquinone/menaquinone biosynthesis C-methylase UbiE